MKYNSTESPVYSLQIVDLSERIVNDELLKNPDVQTRRMARMWYEVCSDAVRGMDIIQDGKESGMYTPDFQAIVARNFMVVMAQEIPNEPSEIMRSMMNVMDAIVHTTQMEPEELELTRAFVNTMTQRIPLLLSQESVAMEEMMKDHSGDEFL